ncbi:MAG: dipeptide ABC transporter ATP-binding protein [Pseudomonadaceae bacterium]|nr:dipeptide ABC transporter ATP-binding protein [Pseudomonadaceae bacterium]
MTALLQVENLVTEFRSQQGETRAVKGISFHIDRGETVCLVGESGSGKSVTGLSILGLLADTASHPQGEIKIVSLEPDAPAVSLLNAPDTLLQTIRGARIAMIFQEPLTCLNPVLTIGEQISEVLQLHLGLEGTLARERTLSLLEQVEIPDPAQRIDDYPHRLSGGQRQRVMIAMALACEPDLIIADEPTTALDVTIQAQILSLMKELQRVHGTALLFITHDLSLVSEIADRVIVMQQGEIVEGGRPDAVLRAPEHPYTQELLQALPGNLPRLQPMAPRSNDHLLTIDALKVYFPIRKGVFQRHVDDVRAVDEVSLDVHRGRVLAVVGESGSGKSTLGRALLGLVPTTSGAVHYNGVDLTTLNRRGFRPYRKALQMIFQDPQSSLNPRLSIASILTEPMAVHGIGANATERLERAAEYLEMVELSPDMLQRYPHEFSGGQRQRIGIARAIALEPEFIVCDEVTSALDVSVQAKVLLLLDKLKRDLNLTYLFITHNIDVVRYFADDIAVMQAGRVVESGEVVEVCNNPQQAYTQELLAAVPRFS